MTCQRIEISSLLSAVAAADADMMTVWQLGSCSRSLRDMREWQSFIFLDRFNHTNATCAFIRLTSEKHTKIRLEIDYRVSVTMSQSGGWLVTPDDAQAASYWMPRLPVSRQLDTAGHILKEVDAPIVAFGDGGEAGFIDIEKNPGHALDIVVWRIPSADHDLLAELINLHTIETQAIFLWGSHTNYRRPADIYLHLIHGHVYENQFGWPHRWKICSEDDAHALYVALTGLEKSTGKSLYKLLKCQVLLAVVSRQSEDGGWRHGEWTKRMEAHFRFNAGAMHVLIDALQEHDDPEIRCVLHKAAEFISGKKDDTDAGVWFLHDELELSRDGMSHAPCKWQPSRFMGKSETNMLVLNTHLDTTIVLDRYREATGDVRYVEQVESAHNAVRVVLDSRPAELLYRLLFKAIGLTMLPADEAAALPLPVRAVKRITWKYLIPNLYRIKSRYPRLVMPGGYIDRAIPLKGWAFHYLTINIMDLQRYRRRFCDETLSEIIDAAIRFTQHSPVRKRWRELEYEKYALGFWAEALYQRCLQDSDVRHRVWLAEVVQILEDMDMGLPPSLLGSNGEAVPSGLQAATPSPSVAGIRVANLGYAGAREYLLVNTTSEEIAGVFVSDVPGMQGLTWKREDDTVINYDVLTVPPYGWIRGVESLTGADVFSH